MKLNSQKAFTLIETIVIIVIIGILATVAFPRYLDSSDPTKTDACRQNQAAIESAAAMYYAQAAIQGSPAYPGTLTDLVPDYFSAAPTCPSSGAYSIDESGVVTCSVASHDR